MPKAYKPTPPAAPPPFFRPTPKDFEPMPPAPPTPKFDPRNPLTQATHAPTLFSKLHIFSTQQAFVFHFLVDFCLFYKHIVAFDLFPL